MSSECMQHEFSHSLCVFLYSFNFYTSKSSSSSLLVFVVAYSWGNRKRGFNFIQFQAPYKLFAYEYYTRSNQFDLDYTKYTTADLAIRYWTAKDRLMVYYCCLFHTYGCKPIFVLSSLLASHTFNLTIDFTVTKKAKKQLQQKRQQWPH